MATMARRRSLAADRQGRLGDRAMSQFYAKADDEYQCRQAVLGNSIIAVAGLGADDDLIPRGGGAFLAEVDGNIALQKLDSLIVANAQGKFRGPEFSPLSFELHTVRHPILKDVRGRDIPTVIARAVDAEGKSGLERTGREDEDSVLRAVDRSPGANPTDIARTLGWRLRGGALHHVKVKRALERLKKDKLVEDRRGGWHVTKNGQRDLNSADTAAAAKYPSVPSVPLPPFKRPSE
jgi:hypothetical protein